MLRLLLLLLQPPQKDRPSDWAACWVWLGSRRGEIQEIQSRDEKKRRARKTAREKMLESSKNPSSTKMPVNSRERKNDQGASRALKAQTKDPSSTKTSVNSRAQKNDPESARAPKTGRAPRARACEKEHPRGL